MVKELFELDDETSKHMNDAEADEVANPPVEEKPVEEVKAEAPTPEEKPAVERPRRPDGTFAPKDAEVLPVEQKVEKPVEKAVEKPVEKTSRPPEGYVAHGAFHEERERRKALQSQMEAMEKRFAETLAKLNPPAPPPDPNQDFPGHVQHHFNQFAQKTQELEKKVSGFEQMTQQQQEEARFVQAYSAAAQQFASRQPDFQNAYNHWLTGRLEELKDAGYTEEQALHIRAAEEKGLVAKAFEDGVNPAERLFAVAKRRGYTVPSVSPAEVVKPAVDPLEKLKQIEAGQKATPQMGGSGMKPKLTLGAVAQMSDDEFNSLDWEKLRELMP